MTRNLTPGLALPLLIALGTGTAVYAQDATTGTDTSLGANIGTPLDWDEPMNDAFFSDTTAGTLRADAEISTNWADLTPEQQERVRQHCETVSGDAGTAADAPVAGADGAISTQTPPATDGTAPADGASTDTTAESDSTATAGDTTATADSAATGTLSVEEASANMSQLCSVVTGL